MQTSRRTFLQVTAATVASFTLPFNLEAATNKANPSTFAPNAFIEIFPDGTIALTVHRSEMGQGIRTTLAMVLCDELDADWAKIKVIRAQGDAKYGDQNTVGDASIFLGWQPLRTAAATARQMLINAASHKKNVPAADLSAQNGFVIAKDGKRMGYGELAALAAKEVAPTGPKLKVAADYKIIGTKVPGVDLVAQTTGALTFGLDVSVPGMQYAVIARAPLPDTKLKSFDASATKAVAGVSDVFAMESQFMAEGHTYAGVVVVARDSWSCIKGRRALKVEWEANPAAMDSPQIRAAMQAAADKPGVIYRSGGDVAAARTDAKKIIRRRYATPFMTHATLEPPNCTAHVQGTNENARCEVWAPTQNPGDNRERIAEALKIPIANVTVNVTAIGGGFGRKSLHDFVLEAVRISKRLGKPVKLFWTREDDLQHGFYRSPSVQELEAGIDAHNAVNFWRHHTVQSSQQSTSDGETAKELQAYELLAGVSRFPYSIPNLQFEGAHVETPLRRVWMRGVQEFYHAFAANCFMDELAVETGRDPLQMRIDWLLPARRIQFFASRAHTDYWFDSGRMIDLIKRMAEVSKWSQPLPAGRGRGFAVHIQSSTYVAMVAEVTARPDATFSIDKMICVTDCGLVLNPDSARAQVEGAILYGMSSCLTGEITLKDGRVAQSNFHDYTVTRITDSPQMVIEFMGNGKTPTGLGEPCVPLVAPAIVNAIANAGLQRRYELPLRKG